MSDAAKGFLDAWVKKNLAFVGEARDETASTMEADALAESCVTEAESVGITEADLQAEGGDLVAFMQGKLDAQTP